VLLVADPADGDQPGLGEPGQFPLHGAGTRFGQCDQLGGVEGSFRLAEQQRQHFLLRRGEQRIGNPEPAWGTGSVSRSGSGLTHSGYDNTRFGLMQQCVFPKKRLR
jgi:hypothetical protein